MPAPNARFLPHPCQYDDAALLSEASTQQKTFLTAGLHRATVLTILLGLTTLLGSRDTTLSNDVPTLARAFSSLRADTYPLSSGDAVQAVIIIENTDESLIFSALGRDWSIALEPQALLSPAARAELAAELADADLPGFYGGQVVGEPGSWVRFARQNGRLTGHVASDGVLHRLLPPPTSSNGTGSNGAGQALEATGYRLVRVGRGALQGDFSSSTAARPTTRASAIGQREGAPLVTRAMRVGIVVDSLYDADSDGEGLARALVVMNGVDGLYREQLGLAVIVDSVRVHDSAVADPLSALTDTSVDNILATFRRIRQADSRLSEDLALVHLFTGHQDPEAAIGLGWIGTVCRDDGYDVSMSTPFAFDTLLSAHEIGHNLGALHDEDPRCNVAEALLPELGIMEARLSGTTTTEFSACSRQSLEDTLSAECFIDSFDLAIRVGASETPHEAGQRLVVQVENRDPWRTASAVTSRLQLPEDSLFAPVTADCTIYGTLLVCRHGDIAPGTEVSITAKIDRLLPGEIVASLLPGNYHDNAPDNDSMRITLSDIPAPADDAMTPAPSEERVTAASSVALDAVGTSPAATLAQTAVMHGEGAGGSGILLAGLLALIGAARRATDQVSRSTEKAAMRIRASRYGDSGTGASASTARSAESRARSMERSRASVAAIAESTSGNASSPPVDIAPATASL